MLRHEEGDINCELDVNKNTTDPERKGPRAHPRRKCGLVHVEAAEAHRGRAPGARAWRGASPSGNKAWDAGGNRRGARGGALTHMSLLFPFLTQGGSWDHCASPCNQSRGSERNAPPRGQLSPRHRVGQHDVRLVGHVTRGLNLSTQQFVPVRMSVPLVYVRVRKGHPTHHHPFHHLRESCRPCSSDSRAPRTRWPRRHRPR